MHPFHPLCGRDLPVVSERHNRHGDRVWFRAEDGSVFALPRQWTSLWAPDAFELASAGRACFRPDDLARLVDLISSIWKQVNGEAVEGEDV